ncbi:hypothetical protein LJC59_02000 [Desulfovibrio sp. OttesenSCG-928-A18]|nr:hypothetical protein [Desulfovibrio sp. OttesenSCG-928-A18]
MISTADRQDSFLLGQKPEQALRILVMCGNEAAPVAAANIYAGLLGAHELRFLEERTLSPGRIRAFSVRRLRSKGLSSLLSSYLLYIHHFLRPLKKEERRYKPLLTVSDFSRNPRVEACINDFQPQIIIIGFCGLLDARFLTRIRKGTRAVIYNTHPGINPRYRGFGNIWAFYENNPACTGYTIHEVDAGIDTGRRVAVRTIDFTGVPFAYMDVHAARIAAGQLSRFILGQERPEIPPQFQNLPSACYGVPGYGVYRKARAIYHSLFPKSARRPEPGPQRPNPDTP